jgi:AcrR family transcriptional regulator
VTIKSAAKRGRPGHDQEAVLAAAVETFNRHGYEATSMGMLAEALGVSKSAIYHHVPSKVELLRLALDDALSALESAADDAERAAQAQAAADNGGHGTAGSVADLMRGTVRVLVEKQPQVRLLLRLRGNSDVELEAIERRRAVDRRTAALIEAAQRSGELRSDVEPRELARLMFGMINSIVEWHKPGGRRSDDDLAAAVVAVLMDGARAT